MREAGFIFKRRLTVSPTNDGLYNRQKMFEARQERQGGIRMKNARSVFKKRLAFVSCIIMLISLLSVTATAVTDAAQEMEIVPGVKISAVKDATGVTATLKNLTAANVSANFIFAVYEPNGRLSYQKIYSVTAEAAASVIQRFDYDTASHPDYIIKLFAWDILGLVPQCNDLSSSRCIVVDGSNVVYDGATYVGGDPAVTAFSYVKLDELTKRGMAYSATKSDNRWAHTRASDVDVIIAYRSPERIGAALPHIEMADLRIPNGSSRTRVVITLTE
ncbi:MAG: hypothetical protein LBH86_09870 [Oscillospiraceae bacterium]|nr:hypothetical protein [Oscillospiraceae bacterium]